eukprot:544273-Pleurochrysis_carterae.AAC.1
MRNRQVLHCSEHDTNSRAPIQPRLPRRPFCDIRGALARLAPGSPTHAAPARACARASAPRRIGAPARRGGRTKSANVHRLTRRGAGRREWQEPGD